MSILSDFEDRLARGVEGLFAGAFRSPVQPAELARALARAMDDGRTLGVAKVYAPTRYTVALGPQDTDQLRDFAPTLAGELATFLVAHAGEQGYDLVARPSVEFAVHDDLKLGRFRVSAQMGAAPEKEPGAPVAAPAQAPVPAPVPEAPAPDVDDRPLDERVPQVPGDAVRGLATVTVSDLHHDIVLKGEHIVIGRLSECDICLADANVSRQHAHLVREGDGWAVQDKGSTNGTFLNGTRVEYARLLDGDVVQIGATQLVYHEPRG